MCQGQNVLGSLSLSTGLTPSHNRAECDCGSFIIKNVLDSNDDKQPCIFSIHNLIQVHSLETMTLI